MSEREKGVLDGLEGYTPGPWRTLAPTKAGGVLGDYRDVGIVAENEGQPTVIAEAWLHGPGPDGARITLTASSNGRLIAAAPDLVTALRAEREKVRVLREALEWLCPVEEGFTEAFDGLVERGLLVPVPADEAFRSEWGGETMYVWRWSALAQTTPTEPAP